MEASIQEEPVKVFRVKAGATRASVTVTYDTQGRPVHVKIEANDHKVDLNVLDIDILAALTKHGVIKWE